MRERPPRARRRPSRDTQPSAVALTMINTVAPSGAATDYPSPPSRLTPRMERALAEAELQRFVGNVQVSKTISGMRAVGEIQMTKQAEAMGVFEHLFDVREGARHVEAVRLYDDLIIGRVTQYVQNTDAMANTGSRIIGEVVARSVYPERRKVGIVIKRDED